MTSPSSALKPVGVAMLAPLCSAHRLAPAPRCAAMTRPLQHLKRAAHLRAVEIALRLHEVLQETQLILGNEELKLASLGEISLGCKE